MQTVILHLEKLLDAGSAYLRATSLAELEYKPAPLVWSKKEILGHLIDSALHNLQRFSEIQFEAKPYMIRKYRQDDFVLANDYQHANLEELIQCWLSMNRRIAHVMRLQTPETLAFKILIGEDDTKNLEFLMVDYVDHLEHHLEEIETPRSLDH